MCYHLATNYRYYTGRTTNRYPEREVFVARTESLWEDLRRLDERLGGDGKAFDRNHVHDHGSSNYTFRSVFSREGKHLLCCGLLGEIQIYESLIVSAMNLEYEEKVQTMDALLADCNGDDESSSVRWVEEFSWLNWASERCPVLTS
jgi:hypothetical protein